MRGLEASHGNVTKGAGGDPVVLALDQDRADHDAVRRARYGTTVADPAGPVRGDLLAFEHLIDEPFYQLVRQQLLAHALEEDAPRAPSGFAWCTCCRPGTTRTSSPWPAPSTAPSARTVTKVWQRPLRRPDRFLSLDSAVFLDPSVTSGEYLLRYGDGLILDEPTLLRTYGIETARELEDVLDFDGDILARDDGLELVVGCVGWHLPYPFFVPELQELVDAVEREVDETWQHGLTDEKEGDT